jgi:hypothetical protein
MTKRKPAKPTKPGSAEREAAIVAVLERLETHGMTRRACREAGVVWSTFLHWMDDDEPLRHRYARAKADGIDAEAERMTEVADDSSLDPQDRRVRLDTRKWLFARLRPEVYGDRVQAELSGRGGGPIQIEASVLDTLRQVYGDDE